MTIQRFDTINEEGLFQDFTWPNNLADFSAVNLIYGWNGTGKTTLSNLMAKFANQDEMKKLNAKIIIDDKDMPSSQSDELSYHVKVFNRNYISKTISVMSEDKVDPIYFIGSEENEAQTNIKQYNKELSKLKDELHNAKQDKDSANKVIDEFCVKQAKKIKTQMRTIGEKAKKYHDYNKTNYRTDADKLFFTKNLRNINNEDTPNLNILLNQIKEPTKEKINVNEYICPDLHEIENKTKNILQSEIVHETIEALQNNPQLEEWTRQGLKIFESGYSEECPWCLQEVDKNRIEKLKGYFTKNFENMQQNIIEIENEINSIIINMSDLGIVDDFKLYPDIHDEFRAAESNFFETFKTITEWLHKILSDINEKKTNMTQSVEISKKAPSLDTKIFDQMINVINDHNQKCDDFENDINKTLSDIIKQIILKERGQFISKVVMFDQCNRKVENISIEIKGKEEKIEKEQLKARDSKAAIDELNQEITDFFGHSEIQFIEKEEGYTLRRNGNTIRQLSDGEISTISLLYFLKSIKDEDISADQCIIVIDDPVSSLDSENTFRTTMTILERTKEFHQLFLFTHNLTLFRETIRELRRKNMTQGSVELYMLMPTKGENRIRKGKIVSAPKVLTNYYSEYDFLFESVLKVCRDEVPSTEWHYNLPNMTRRLLESFAEFQFSKEKKLTETIEQIDNFPTDKKKAIHRFLNTYSHMGAIPDRTQEDNVIAETKVIIKYVIEMIEHVNPEHFNNMVSAIEKLNTKI